MNLVLTTTGQFCVKGTVIIGAPWERVAIATKLGYFFSEPILVKVDDENCNSVNLTATHVMKVESTVLQHNSTDIRT